jgi:hypothetical protein
MIENHAIIDHFEKNIILIALTLLYQEIKNLLSNRIFKSIFPLALKQWKYD